MKEQFFKENYTDENIRIVKSQQENWETKEVTEGILVSVTEEHAMDSYNRAFECTFFLNNEEVQELIEFLKRQLETGL